jgi:hypothetical protein
MSDNYNTSVRNSRLQAVVAAIDAGPANGRLRLLDGAGNVLSTITLAKPCASVAGGVLTFTLPLLDTNTSGAGQAITARCEDSTGVIVISGLTVNADPSIAADILILPSNVIRVGQAIGITSATITGN